MAAGTNERVRERYCMVFYAQMYNYIVHFYFLHFLHMICLLLYLLAIYLCSLMCLYLLFVCVFPTKYCKLIQCHLASKFFNFIVIFGSQTL